MFKTCINAVSKMRIACAPANVVSCIYILMCHPWYNDMLWEKKMIIFDVRCSDKVKKAIELLCPCGKHHWPHLSVMRVIVSGYFRAETKHY